MAFDGSTGQDESPSYGENNNDQGYYNSDSNNGTANNSANNMAPSPEDPFIPEEEIFLVREVATTDSHVIVPNTADDSHTVALIDGDSFQIQPIQVGFQPKVVRAAQLDDNHSVAYVLCTGSSEIAIVRPEQRDPSTGEIDVNLLTVPREVNALAVSPNGRYLLAYIDPDQPSNENASVASLQTLALVKLGDTPDEDRVFELSVTRLIRDIQFSADSTQAFILGQEGVNRLTFADISQDMFIAPIELELSNDIFAPEDQQMQISAGGNYMVIRTSQFSGFAIYEFAESDSSQPGTLRVFDLGEIPSDIQLIESSDNEPTILIALRSSEQLIRAELDELLIAEDDDLPFTVIDVTGAQAGIARITPDASKVLLFSTLNIDSRLSIFDVATNDLSTYGLRNQIRNVAISPDSKTAIVVHTKQPGNLPINADSDDVFQHSDAMTIVDIATGYRRPLLLPGTSDDIILTQNSSGAGVVYAMVTHHNSANQGIVRINMDSFRMDFVQLPRHPLQLGLIRGKIFVQQDSPTGRMTFFDIDSNEQRTISGYELNAGIN